MAHILYFIHETEGHSLRLSYPSHPSFPDVILTKAQLRFIPILPGGEGGFRPLMFFFHHPETTQAMKLKLSDFKDTCLRHILQVIPGCYILRCYHGNKITKGTLQNFTQ